MFKDFGTAQDAPQTEMPPIASHQGDLAQINKDLQSQQNTAAQDWLKDGHAIGIFPGGGVSTSEKPLRGAALDLPWAPFTSKLIRSSGATVVPVHFSGQNSRLFQIASHLSLTLRLSLIFRETARRIGTRLDVRIGNPIPSEDLAHLTDRTELVAELRRITFALAPQNHIDWMRHGRIKETDSAKS